MLNVFLIQVLKIDKHTGKFECILSSSFFHCEKPQESWWQKPFSVKEWVNHEVNFIQGWLFSETFSWMFPQKTVFCMVLFCCVQIPGVDYLVELFLLVCRWGSSSLPAETDWYGWNILLQFLPSILQVSKKCLCSSVCVSDTSKWSFLAADMMAVLCGGEPGVWKFPGSQSFKSAATKCICLCSEVQPCTSVPSEHWTL